MIYPSSAENIRRAAAMIRAGGLVVMPTETVYGLAADALDATAVKKIFEAKGRPQSNPLIVHVADLEMARSLAVEWPDDAQALAERFWPGPLTIVVSKRSEISDVVTAGLPSVALRHPAHPAAQALLMECGRPIAAPSANRFTQLSPTTAEHVPPDLAEMILDGGPCKVGIESTVISLVGGARRILRPGMVTRSEIEDSIGAVEVGAGGESPGQHPRHYSPRTPLIFGDSPESGNGVRLDFATMPSEPVAYAEAIYRTLHELDRRELDWIAIDPLPDTREWDALRDRLRRAAQKAERI